MFQKPKTLSDTLSSVNKFIAELKSGVEKHKQKNNSITSEIEDLYAERDNLANEVFQAEQLIGTLSGNNSKRLTRTIN